MCMEDYKLGRATYSTFGSIAVTTSATVLCRADIHRTSLIISCPVANRVTISDKPGVTDQDGIVLYLGQSPLVLDLIHHGSFVTKMLFAISNSSTNTIGVAETF